MPPTVSEAQGEERLLQFPRRRKRGASYCFRGAGRGAPPTVSVAQGEGHLLLFPRSRESGASYCFRGAGRGAPPTVSCTAYTNLLKCMMRFDLIFKFDAADGFVPTYKWSH